MVTAKEARGLAKKSRNEIIEKQKQELEKLILKACTDGEFFIEFQKRLLEEVAEWLMDLGYNIEEESDEEFTIEWEFLADEAINNDEEGEIMEDDGVEEDFNVEDVGLEEEEKEAAMKEETFFDEELAGEDECKMEDFEESNETSTSSEEATENQANESEDSDDDGDEDDRK